MSPLYLESASLDLELELLELLDLAVTEVASEPPAESVLRFLRVMISLFCWDSWRSFSASLWSLSLLQLFHHGPQVPDCLVRVLDQAVGVGWHYNKRGTFVNVR